MEQRWTDIHLLYSGLGDRVLDPSWPTREGVGGNRGSGVPGGGRGVNAAPETSLQHCHETLAGQLSPHQLPQLSRSFGGTEGVGTTLAPLLTAAPSSYQLFPAA